MEARLMKRAVELARKGQGKTSPNPCVGAVIVSDGKVLAEGWHEKAGEAHAEVVALEAAEAAGVDVRGAEMYVTLEPCNHVGRTGACAERLVEAGVGRVFVGMRDPFEKVNGRGIELLEKAGIAAEVCDGELEKEVRMLNQPFIKWCETGMPYVVLKAGMSLDGKIATAGGESQWITGEVARQEARAQRALCDAVLVGSGTVKSDNPELAGALRVIIDGKLSCNVGAKVFRDKDVFVACTDKADADAVRRFEEAGIDFRSFGEDWVDLKKLLRTLGERGVQSVYVEGGSVIHGAFVDGGLVDKVLFYLAPKIIGGEEALSAIGGKGVTKLAEVMQVEDLSWEKVGEDLKLEGVVKFY